MGFLLMIGEFCEDSLDVSVIGLELVECLSRSVK
jgi:hypothetical protein